MHDKFFHQNCIKFLQLSMQHFQVSWTSKVVMLRQANLCLMDDFCHPTWKLQGFKSRFVFSTQIEFSCQTIINHFLEFFLSLEFFSLHKLHFHMLCKNFFFFKDKRKFYAEKLILHEKCVWHVISQFFTETFESMTSLWLKKFIF